MNAAPRVALDASDAERIASIRERITTTSPFTSLFSDLAWLVKLVDRALGAADAALVAAQAAHRDAAEDRARAAAEIVVLRTERDEAREHRDQLMRWLGDVAVRLGVIEDESLPWKYSAIARAVEALKRERDARPAIAPEDAVAVTCVTCAHAPETHAAVDRINAALCDQAERFAKKAAL